MIAYPMGGTDPRTPLFFFSASKPPLVKRLYYSIIGYVHGVMNALLEHATQIQSHGIKCLSKPSFLSASKRQIYLWVLVLSP